MKIGRRVLDTLNSDKEAGFSLIEVAVALSIVGVMLSIALPMYTRYQQAACWRKTEENQKEVVQALTAYFSSYLHLPYAGDESGHTIEGETIGYIPYRQLSIPAKLARDGFNKPMRYAAHPGLAKNENDDSLGSNHEILKLLKLSEVKNKGPNLVVTNGTGVSLAKNDMPIAFVLIAGQPSHSADEQKNWDASNDFVDRPFSTNEGDLFRQKIYWINYPHLALKAGVKIPSDGETQPEPSMRLPPRNQSPSDDHVIL